MKKIIIKHFIRIFIIFTFFPSNGFAGFVDGFLRSLRFGGKQEQIPRSEKRGIRSYLEEHPDLVANLGGGDFDKAYSKLIEFYDNELAFTLWLQMMWGFDQDVFSQIWGMERFRTMAFNFMRREHILDSGDDLFFKWLNEAQSRGLPEMRSRLRGFVDDSVKKIKILYGNGFLSGEELLKILMEKDPFWQMLIRCSRENEPLNSFINEIGHEIVTRNQNDN